MGERLVKRGANYEVPNGYGEVIYLLVETVTQCKMGDRGREVGERLVECREQI